MKFLVLFSCALAVASAGIVAPIAYAGYGIHLPVIDASGVPVDTAEVQQAKAAHATHHVVAASRAGAYEYAPYVAHAYAAPVLAPVLAAAHPVLAAGHHAYPTTAVHPVVTADGIPLNTPEVAAATADHIAAHHEALGRIAHNRKRRGVVAAAYAPYDYTVYGAQHLPTIDASGVPVDTVEVQHAKAAHAIHHAVAASRAGAYEYAPYVAQAYAVPVLAPVLAVAHPVLAAGNHAYPTTAVHPAVTADGIPLNTPEVAAATANHIAAHHEALGRIAHYRKRRGVVAAVYAPYAYASYGAQHLPTIDASGVPVDTAEVQYAKAAHATHYAVASTRAAYGVPVVAAPAVAYAAPWAINVPAIAHDGTPLDTPEVAHAKAAHFAAYNAEAARNSVHSYVAHAYADPYAYAVPLAAVPVDTPEVAQAKVEHFAAHAAVHTQL